MPEGGRKHEQVDNLRSKAFCCFSLHAGIHSCRVGATVVRGLVAGVPTAILNKSHQQIIYLIYNIEMEQSQWERSLAALQTHLSQLEQSLSARMQRFTPFKNLFNDLHKACDRFAAALVAIADGCDQEILSTLTESEQVLGGAFVAVRAGLLGAAECWRLVAGRAKNEVLQPVKVFAENYRKVGSESSGKLKQHLGVCLSNAQEVARCRELYYACCDRLEKHKDGQAKIMMRIENGEPGELQRFNKTTRMLLEKVSSSQQKYMQAVDRANEQTTRLRGQVERQALALRNNQTARVQFLKKNAQNQLKILELGRQLNLNFKQENTPIRIDGRGRSELSQALEKVTLFSKNYAVEVFVSHEQLAKSKKHKQFQQENPLLMELFNKVRQAEKAALGQFVQGCLQMEPACKLVSIQKGQKGEAKMVFPPDWQNCREKIFSLQQHLLYFAYLLERQLNDYPHYYLKLSPPFFIHLLNNLLLPLLDRLDLNADGAMGDIAVSTVYKLLKLGERVVERRKERRVVGNMKIMIEGLGACKRLREEKTLRRLLRYLLKKGQKKREGKGVVSFTKGLFSTLTGKKDDSSSEEQEFNALVQLTHLMANLSLPSEIALPFLKNCLKNSGEASYQYLKDIVQGRRDRQQRQKLLHQQDPRFKLQREFKQILESKTAAAVALRITAQRGFLSKEGLQLRLTCKALSSIHQHIIYRLPVPLGVQWRWLCDPAPLDYYNSRVEGIVLAERESQVQEVIHLDVNRSLHLHIDELPHVLLKRFLVCYARAHPEMAYCQGMNYLAGYVLLKAKMDASAYSIFCSVMERHFLQIFANNFAGMRLKLYLFQRLLAIFHPDLSDHFKREMITPECYAVGWIITAFTSTYQYARQSVLVDWLWARFVPWGWKEFYRLAMGLMQLNREVLLASGYDGCLQVLGEIPKSKTLTCSDREAFMKEWGSDLQTMLEVFPISDRLLARLAEQFQHQ